MEKSLDKIKNTLESIEKRRQVAELNIRKARRPEQESYNSPTKKEASHLANLRAIGTAEFKRNSSNCREQRSNLAQPCLSQCGYPELQSNIKVTKQG